MKVSAIIVNYNAGEALQRAVSSVALCEAIDRVVVVDNASRDDSMTCFRSVGDFGGKLRVIENARNLGFAAACNQALDGLEQPFLLYLNPDCVMSAEALDGLLAIAQANPDAGMLGPVLRYPDGRVQEGGRRAAPTPWLSFVRASGLYRLSRFFPKLFADFVLPQESVGEGVCEVDAISGACMLVRRAAIDIVGRLDEGYFLHCEDLDWCLRFNLAGWKVLFVPHLSVTHEKGVCSASRPVFVAWHKHLGMARFYRKFYAARHVLLVRAFIIAGVWIHFLAKLPAAWFRSLK